MIQRRFGLGLAIVAVSAVLAGLILLMPFNLHRIEITTHFQNGLGLREGAPVRLAGVDVGRVARVRVRPEDKQGAVEVQMKLATAYELRIPSDSVVFPSREGVLGETYVNIDAMNASGPPIKNHGQLKGQEIPLESSDQLIQRFGEALSKRACHCNDKEKATKISQETGPVSLPSDRR